MTTINIYNNNISDTIATRIKLKNLSEKDIDINNLEIVYLYQNDGNENEVFECDWAGQDNKYITNSVNGTISYDESLGCSKISVKFTKEDNCMLTPDAILDVHFRVHTINWDKYDLSNDLSFHPELEYTENSKMLIYYNGELVNDSAT